MALLDEQVVLMPSVLDRLVDVSLRSGGDRPWYEMSQMVAAVQRDLEELLNTRETHQGLCDDLPEVQRSLVTYGLPDIANVDLQGQRALSRLCEAIERAVTQFEPRLKDVKAVPLTNPDPKQRGVKFGIEGRLALDPAPDVVFDTTLELATRHFVVTSTGP
jgi:type VI secretion system protein ImpF